MCQLKVIRSIGICSLTLGVTKIFQLNLWKGTPVSKPIHEVNYVAATTLIADHSPWAKYS